MFSLVTQPVTKILILPRCSTAVTIWRETLNMAALLKKVPPTSKTSQSAINKTWQGFILNSDALACRLLSYNKYPNYRKLGFVRSINVWWIYLWVWFGHDVLFLQLDMKLLEWRLSYYKHRLHLTTRHLLFTLFLVLKVRAFGLKSIQRWLKSNIRIW